MPDRPARDPELTVWLDAELEELWLVGERLLRDLQELTLRPQPGHPSLSEVEGILGARRQARAGGAVATSAELHAALRAHEAPLQAARAQVWPRLRDSFDLRPHEILAAVAALAPTIDPATAELFAALRASTIRRGVDLALLAQLFRLRPTERLELLDVIDEARPLSTLRLIQVVAAQDVFSSTMYRALQATPDLLWLLTGAHASLSPSLRAAAKLLSGAVGPVRPRARRAGA